MSIICFFRGLWRSYWCAAWVSGHDFVEVKKDVLVCEDCGHRIEVW